MAKMPFFKFYPHDWLYDTRVLTDSEKAVLIDLLCFMWNAPARGILTGHTQDLARMMGKEWGEFSVLLDGLQRKGILDVSQNVTKDHNDVTIENRRMVREEKERESAKLRKRAQREKSGHGKVTPKKSEVRSQNKDSLSEPLQDAVGLAELLKSLILGNNPNARVPTSLDRWAVEAERLLRRDKRPPSEAEALLRWSQEDPFWRTNILSMEKFRMQYDQLKLKSEMRSRIAEAPREIVL